MAAIIAAAPVQAAPVLPTGGTVLAGTVSIGSPGASSLTISQSSAKGIVDWGAFSIGAGATVRFDNGAGATLNRVTGSALSSIDGLLSASGSVYLLNANGVVIGKTGVVDVGGRFVASTLDLSDAAFLKGGDLTFSGTSTASVINLGRVGSLGGDVALIATTVSNQGSINAAQGAAGLLAGSGVLVRDQALDGGKFAVLVGGAGASATNSGTIEAATAELRANGGDVYALAGDTAGVIRATGTATTAGRVFLIAENGPLSVAGVLHAENADGTGGSIETSGGAVSIGAAAISTGRGGGWLVDPVDLTVDTTAASTISQSLATTNVTLQTTATSAGGPGVQTPNGSGDITVAAPISWSSANGLTLSAYRNVNVNAGLTATGGGGVTLYADNTGTGVGTVAFGGGIKASTSGAVNLFYNPVSNPAGSLVNTTSYTNPTSYTGAVVGGATLTASMLVNTVNDLQNIQNNLSGIYAIGRNIDSTATTYWNSSAGFVPIAQNGNNAFVGILDGQQHSIAGLSISQNPGVFSPTGLFSYIGKLGIVKNLSLTNAVIIGGSDVGILVGYNSGVISGVSAAGTVTGGRPATGGSGGGSDVGGLIGQNLGSVQDAYTNVTIVGLDSTSTAAFADYTKFVGGLVGENEGVLNRVSSSGSIVSGNQVGGLVGLNEGTISNAHSDANVTATTTQGTLPIMGEAGGLIGSDRETSTTNPPTVSNAYSTGSVTAVGFAGGLIGESEYAAITNVWASGPVRGGSAAGLIGEASLGTVANAFWDVGTTGRSVGIGLSLIGRPVPQTNVVGLGGPKGASPYAQANYSGFDFTSAGSWFILDGQTRPLLRSEYSTTIANAHQLQLIALNLGASYTLANDIDLSATTSASDVWGPGGFAPLGADASGHSTSNFGFGGTLDGQGHTLSNLTINAPSRGLDGLFGSIAPSGQVANLNLAGVAVQGGFYTGALAGDDYGTINNVRTSGSVSGAGGVGGLIGVAEGGSTTTEASSNTTVQGSADDVGGLAGVGFGQVLKSSAVGAVTGRDFTGGLVGLSGGVVSESYAGGSVSGNGNVGGLVGQNAVNGLILNAYSTASVLNSYDPYAGASVVYKGAGGLAGLNLGAVSNAYASGSVSGALTTGGLVGLESMNGVSGTLTNAYWDAASTGQSRAYSGAGLSQAGAASVGDSGPSPYAQATYAGFDFTAKGPWVIFDGATRPILRSEYSTTIGTAHQLQLVALNLAANYTLANDVDLTGTSRINDIWSPAGFLPVGPNASGLAIGTGFTGSLDGQGHTLANLFINRQSGENVGLFGFTSSARIQNISLSNASVRSGAFAGTLIGYDAPGGTTTVSNITVSGALAGGQTIGGVIGQGSASLTNVVANVAVTGAVGYTGGLIGRDYGGSVAFSSSSGTITGGDYVGGLLGTFEDQGVLGKPATVSDSSATGAVNAVGGNVGGLVGEAFGGALTRVSATGSVNGSGYVGGLIGNLTVSARGNRGSVSNATASGAVSSNGGQDAGGLIGGVSNDTGAFIDGASASGAVSGGGEVGGLIGQMAGAVSNSHATGPVTATDPTVASGVGGLVGADLSVASSYTNDYATGAVTATTTIAGNYSQLVGGLVGSLVGSISNSYATGMVSATNGTEIGGLVGSGGQSIINSYATGNVSGNRQLGGLVGFAAGAITNSYASGAVTGTGAYGVQVGGLVGYNAGSLTSVMATGAVSGGSQVGGLVGANSATGAISQSTSGASVIGSGYVGGAVGDNFGTLMTVSSSGAVNGAGGTGGLIGVNEAGAAVTGSSSSSAVTGIGNDVGGVAGANFGAIGGSMASGAVSGQDHTGGLVGYNSGAVGGSTASGAVTGADYVGGLVGLNYAAVSASHATGRVNGTQYVGGLVGWNTSYGSVDGSDASGPVTGGSYVGGLVGVNQNTVTNSRALASATVSGGRDVGGLVGLNQGSLSRDGAANAVTGDVGVGGLVGWNDTGATVSQSYATGAATGRPGGADPTSGDDYVGGLVGVNFGALSDVYATGGVTGAQVVGGLVGANLQSGTVINAYALAKVTATRAAGGVFGVNAGQVRSTYWATTSTTQGFATGYDIGQGAPVAIGPGAAFPDQSAAATYAGFDFTSIWKINTSAAPTLRNAPGQ